MCKKSIDNRIFGLCGETYKIIFNVVNRDYRRCLHSRGRRYKFGPSKMLEIFLKHINILKSSDCRIFYKSYYLAA